MGQIPYDCPHEGCGTKQSAINLIASMGRVVDVNTPVTIGTVFGICTNCKRGLIFEVKNAQGRSFLAPEKHSGIQFANEYLIFRVFPEPVKATIVENLPESVRKPFTEAEEMYAAGMFGSVGAIYRKVIERTLKDKSPDEQGSLFKRIQALEQSNGLPNSLIELLNSIRFLGNDALHADDPTDEEIKSARDFTTLFLVYVYELPARIIDAGKAREDRKAT